jgi:hypothetical protein
MKKVLYLILFQLSFVGLSQTIPPPYINYQAILYDVNGPNPNAPYALQSFPAYINLNDELGNLLYREEHFSSTDANGQVTIKIGDGLYLAGPITNFNQINWASGKYYLVVEFDINGTISATAPEQLVTVPYAFYAGKAGNGVSTITSNGNQTLTITYDNGTTYTTQALAGFQGPQGPAGPQGSTGQSAYDLWLAQGNTGTVDDFLNASAYDIWLAQGNTGTQQDFLNTLVGPQGPQGVQGIQGVQGVPGVQGPAGVDGAQGPQGATGPAGNNGAPGVGIDTVAIINNNLYTTLSDGTVINAGPINVSGSGAIGSRIGFSNNSTWTCPAGVTQITVQLWGGGGGGGAGSRPSGNLGCKPCNNSIYAESSGDGGNGGKGGYNRGTITVVPGTTYNITIGAGGVGGVASTSNCGNA